MSVVVGRCGLLSAVDGCCRYLVGPCWVGRHPDGGIMDRTGSFKNQVQEVKSRYNEVNRAQDENAMGSPSPFIALDKNRILKLKRKKAKVDSFEVKARAIVDNVTRLKEILTENSDSYADVMNNECLADPITYVDRDKIDVAANSFVKTINKLISNFKQDLKKELGKLAAQKVQHLEAVTDLLDGYLRVVCDIHSKQKAIRVEKELEFQRLSRLEVKASSHGGPPPELHSSAAAFSAESEDDGSDEPSKTRLRRRKRRTRLRKSSRGSKDGDSSKPPVPSGYRYSSDDDAAQEEKENGSIFTSDEVQVYEQENEALYEDLISLEDNVQQIESKVVKIAKLQEVFTDKILQQRDDIDLIAGHALASTEHVKDGNEELRKAIQRNASIRVYILFFLLVMSFSLLFLDWYND